MFTRAVAGTARHSVTRLGVKRRVTVTQRVQRPWNQEGQGVTQRRAYSTVPPKAPAGGAAPKSSKNNNTGAGVNVGDASVPPLIARLQESIPESQITQETMLKPVDHFVPLPDSFAVVWVGGHQVRSHLFIPQCHYSSHYVKVLWGGPSHYS